jgi:hypothetical protein
MTPITNPALMPPVGAPVAPAQGAGSAGNGRPAGSAPAAGGPSFADALARANDGASSISFSKHALARVQGVDRAAGKGSRDSLVLVDGTAFVVSVSNRTVITAVGSQHMKDNVFTNIDSAVIA